MRRPIVWAPTVRTLTLPALLALAALLATPAAQACDGCCDRCGCDAHCQKVCRMVCEKKKVEVVCWGCKCEEFCVPGPSDPGCEHGKCVCDPCDAPGSGVRAKAKWFHWTAWIPGCASIETRKKLMKRTETVEVPSFKWVVEECCPACSGHQP